MTTMHQSTSVSQEEPRQRTTLNPKICPIYHTHLSYGLHGLPPGLLHPASHASAFLAQGLVRSEKRSLPQPLCVSLTWRDGRECPRRRKGRKKCDYATWPLYAICVRKRGRTTGFQCQIARLVPLPCPTTGDRRRLDRAYCLRQQKIGGGEGECPREAHQLSNLRPAEQ